MNSNTQNNIPNIVSDTMFGVGIVVVLIGGFIYLNMKAINEFINQTEFRLTILFYSVLILLPLLIGVFCFGRTVHEAITFHINRKKERTEFKQNLNSLNQLIEQPLQKSLLDEYQKLQDYFNEPPFFLKISAIKPLNLINQKITKIQNQIQIEEQQKQNNILQMQRKRQEQLQQIYNIFKKQGHTQSIPEQYKNFDKTIIETAESWFEQHKTQQREEAYEQRRKEEHKKTALLFVHKHHALPTDYSTLKPEDQTNYDNALELYKKGELNTIIAQLREKDTIQNKKTWITDQEYNNLAGSLLAGKDREQQLLKKEFYFLTEINKKDQQFLQTFHNYKNWTISNFGDGFTQVLYHCTIRETPTHFCNKHLFATLHPNARIEVMDWWKNEVDVLFTKGKQKLALEIETGSNKPEYLREKITSLNQAKYNKIIIVTPRENLPKYKIYQDNTKVFVQTPKQAKQTIQDWLNTDRPTRPYQVIPTVSDQENNSFIDDKTQQTA